MGRRVVITGMGVVTPIGIGLDHFEKSLREGRSGDGPVTRFDTKGFRTKRAFEIKNFTPLHGTSLLDPFIQYALASTTEAQKRAQFNTEGVDPYRIGICVSSSKGGLYTFSTLRDRFIKRPSALLAARVYANLVPNFACQWIARKWKISGPAKCFITACATGTTSIIEGARMVEEGIVDYAFAGASDYSLVPFLVAGYEQMGVLSPEGMYPFDKRRNGFLLGEGGGVVFLETFESAKARRAKIYAEIIGSSYGTDCYGPVSFNPKEDALARAVKKLLEKCHLSPDEIDYVNLHGTGTQSGDVYETDQIKQAFGKKAYSLTTSSTKSMMGHMLGASGAVEVIASCLAVGGGFIPPTVHLEKKDPRCDLDYTPGKAREKKVSVAISLSMGFGGHIACIALRKV
ncbi:MAG: beta-ketoacyl-[acyl-carrier-protein] synthase family protein [Candidatus Omnitrophica bacterium]|nr:beta-ketoacyl-[acyl-carrier-protein] synthase family protein [Candidatus Omnitrophota bacterium]